MSRKALYLENILNSHDLSLQSSVLISVVLLGSSVSQYEVHVRVLVRVPSPQVLVQDDHEPQEENSGGPESV